jgi:hypothetical protein
MAALISHPRAIDEAAALDRARAARGRRRRQKIGVPAARS